MKMILKAIFEMTSEYYGTATFLVMAVFVGVLLMLIDIKKYSRMILPVLLTLFVVFNPVCYKIVFSKIRFWRLFWMIPMVYIILLGFMELIKRCDSVFKKTGCLAGLIVLLIIGGDNVFAGSGLGYSEDPYQLPHGVSQACETMLSVDKTPRCVVGGDLRTSVRLYSGSIEPMYGRDAENYIDKASEYDKRVFKEMESECPDYAYIFSNARRLGYNFVVNTSDKPADYELVTEYGYKLLGDKGGYNVYYNPDIPDMDDSRQSGYIWKSNGTGWYCLDPEGNRLKDCVEEIDGVWYYFNSNGFLMESVDSESAETLKASDMIVTAYGKSGPKSEGSTPRFVTVDDCQGNLIIIDGGSKSQYKAVHDVLKMYGRDVTAWILTNDDKNTSGAFSRIYKSFVKDTAEGKSGAHPVNIQEVYTADSFESEEFKEITAEAENIKHISAGDKFKTGGVSIEVEEESDGMLTLTICGEKDSIQLKELDFSENGRSFILH